MMTERQKTGWLYLALVLAVAAFIAFCVPRSQAQIVPIDASRIYVDGSTTSYANYLDTVTGELTIYSTASPAGTTLADLDPTAALAAFTGSANIVTLGTIATGVWSGTALVADKVPGHDSLNGFVAAEHIDWTSTASSLGYNIEMDRGTNDFLGIYFDDFATAQGSIGLPASETNSFEIKSLDGCALQLFNTDSDGITITDTGTNPTIAFDLGDAVELMTFGGDTFGPTITCAGLGPMIILSDAAGASSFLIGDSTATPVAKFDVNSDGLIGVAGLHNDAAGIYVNSLGEVANAIDLSAAGVTTSSDYWIYLGASYGWRADGRIYTPYLSITTGPIKCYGYETNGATADMTFKVLDTDGSAFLFQDSDAATLVSIDADDGNTTIAGDLSFGTDGGVSYASMYITGNGADVGIVDIGVAVQVLDFATNGPNNASCTPDHTSDHITVAVAGDYQINVSATVNTNGGAATVLEMTVQKNNGASVLGGLHVDQSMAGGGGESGSVSMCDIVTLAANDTVEVWIENETSTAEYVVEDISITVVQVGGA